MELNIVTIQDLNDFKFKLIEEIEKLLNRYKGVTLDKWIKSNELMTKLQISPGTLQNLRVNGSLPFTKLGGIIYYNEEEIDKILIKSEHQHDKNH